MNIISGAFTNGGDIPSRYTCDGKNDIPQLVFSGIPAGTKSLAIIVDDPDSPYGVWNHWSMWNIPPGTQGISQDSFPSDTRQGTTTFGNIGYGGPCPGKGKHRYFFKLYALDTMVDLPNGAPKDELLDTIAPHILEVAELHGYYERKKQGV